MHRATVAALLATLVMTGSLPALAAEDKPIPGQSEQQQQQIPAGMISKEQAIAAVRTLFGLEELTEADASYREQGSLWQKGAAWSVVMRGPRGDKETSDGRSGDLVDALVDAKTGEVLNYQRTRRGHPVNLSVTDEQAIRTADTFLKNQLPQTFQKVQQVRLIDKTVSADVQNDESLSWSSTHVIYYERVNGIPFQDNSVQVEVDGDGLILSYTYSFPFDSSKLPSPERAIPQAEAQKRFADRLLMKPHYLARDTVRDEQGRVQLVDQPSLGFYSYHKTQFDAFTGLPDQEDFADLKLKFEPMEMEGLGQNYFAKDQEDAKRLVGEILNTDLSEMQFLLYEGEGLFSPSTTETWDLSWREQSKEYEPGQFRRSVSVYAQFDAKTGQLLNLHKSGLSSTEAAFTVEDGRSKAYRILQQQLPAGKQQVVVVAEYAKTDLGGLPEWFDKSQAPEGLFDDLETEYVYTIVPTHQGIPVLDQTYEVELDPQSGEITALRVPLTGTGSKLPDSKGMLGAAKVKSDYLKNHPLQLKYVWDSFAGQQAPQGALVYTLPPEATFFRYIDAFTGQPVEFPR